MTNAVEQESIKVIVFQLANKEYAIPVSHVQGIEKLMHITRVPKTEVCKRCYQSSWCRNADCRFT